MIIWQRSEEKSEVRATLIYILLSCCYALSVSIWSFFADYDSNNTVDGDDESAGIGGKCEEIKVFHLQCGKTMMLNAHAHAQMLPIISMQKMWAGDREQS